MKYEIIRTTQFKKDYKLALKRGYNIQLLKEVIMFLSTGQTLAIKYRDHALIGNYSNYRECHIQPDWLLVYKIVEEESAIVLYRTGSHSDLF